MRRILGALLLLLGVCVMVGGIAMAMMEFMGIYAHAIDDPLSEPATTEAQTSDAMLRAVLIGAAGFPIAAIGSIMLKIGLIRKLNRQFRERNQIMPN